MQYYEYQPYQIHVEIQIIFHIDLSLKIHVLKFPKKIISNPLSQDSLIKHTRFDAVANKVPVGLSAIAANSPV